MKLILEQEKMFKLTVTQDGQLNVALANGKQYSGPLKPAELEQLLFRVSAISDEAIKFDPAPSDYIGLHDADVATLEAQSLVINSLREQEQAITEALNARIKEAETFNARLADCEGELVKARTELKEALLVIEQQASKLNITKEPPSEPAPVEEPKTADEIPTVPDPQPAAAAEPSPA
jgi:hypothetical protein